MYLSAIAKNGGPVSGEVQIGVGDMRDLNGKQRQAVVDFSNLRTHSLRGGNELKFQQTKRAIENVAYQTALSWYEIFKKEIESKDFVISTGTGSEAMGDLFINAGGKGITLELKWQESPSMPTHWFTLVDSSLFGQNGFKDFLIQNQSIYWTHSQISKEWSYSIEVNALLHFLTTRYSDFTASLKDLVNKGKALENDSRANDVKYVVHGTAGSLTITNLGDLTNSLNISGVGADKWPNFWRQAGTTLVFGQAEKQIAWFGISNFQNKYKPSTKNRDSNEGSNIENLSEEAFTFDMYLNQKLFRDFVSTN